MIELTNEQKLEIAIAMLSECELHFYARACKFAENGMPVLDAINEVTEYEHE